MTSESSQLFFARHDSMTRICSFDLLHHEIDFGLGCEAIDQRGKRGAGRKSQLQVNRLSAVEFLETHHEASILHVDSRKVRNLEANNSQLNVFVERKKAAKRL